MQLCRFGVLAATACTARLLGCQQQAAAAGICTDGALRQRQQQRRRPTSRSDTTSCVSSARKRPWMMLSCRHRPPDVALPLRTVSCQKLPVCKLRSAAAASSAATKIHACLLRETTAGTGDC
jgi:hypothetical protein